MTNDNWNIPTSKKDKKIARRIRILLSSILGLAGIFIVASQFVPVGISYVRGLLLEQTNQSFISPVPGSYKREIGEEFAYWDPGQSYFQNLIQQANIVANDGRNERFDPETGEYTDIVIDRDYKQDMYIDIPSLSINNIKVSTNVDSYTTDVYNTALKDGLAHFQGTSLPGAGGNTLIYGHSAVESFFTRNQDNPETIFTRLEDIEIGDEVTIMKDGEEHSYRVTKKKIVSPSDFSILQTQSRKETVTLMTCHPIGVPTNRLIVIAEEVDG